MFLKKLPSPITHMWFLAVIMQFYLLWPWVMLLITRTTRSRTMQSRIILAMAVFSTILAALLYNPSGDPSRVYYGTDTRLAEILLGACLAIIWPTNGGETKFACVDGPDFDAHEVDFDSLLKRAAFYKDEQDEAAKHICTITGGKRNG